MLNFCRIQKRWTIIQSMSYDIITLMTCFLRDTSQALLTYCGFIPSSPSVERVLVSGLWLMVEGQPGGLETLDRAGSRCWMSKIRALINKGQTVDQCRLVGGPVRAEPFFSIFYLHPEQLTEDLRSLFSKCDLADCLFALEHEGAGDRPGQSSQ